MQIHADSKGTARISYQLLWMTSHYGPTIVRVSRRYHFTFSFDRILFKWGWILHRELYSVSPLCPWSLIFWTQNQFALTDCRGLLLCQVLSHSNQRNLWKCLRKCFRFTVLTYPPAHIHTHCDKVIVISVPLYYVVGVDNEEA